MSRIREISLRISGKYLSDYYRYTPGMSLEEVGRRWAQENNKAYDGVFYFPPNVLWKYREYDRRYEPKGAQEYSDRVIREVTESLGEKGWSPEEPCWIIFGKNGRAKIGEGNHRLVAARSLGLREVPTRFLFYQEVRGGRNFL